MKRWWVSWEEPGEADYRPNGQYPVPEAIKAYWCSGEGEGYFTMCAVVDASDETSVWEELGKSWPDHGQERFIQSKPEGWRPGDRFPWPEWAK